MALLILDNIHAGYGKKEVLCGLSVSVEPGQIVALLGGNGAGKSTALRVACGIARPWSGRVLLNDRDISGLLPHEIKRLGLSYLPQGGRVFKSLTVGENLAVAVNEKAKLGPDRLWFEALTRLWNMKAGFLSGGEKQMLALEMLLCSKSTILLLDEPTAALSVASANFFLSRLREMVRTDGGMSVLLVEQNVDLARQIADTECTLADGTLQNYTLLRKLGGST